MSLPQRTACWLAAVLVTGAVGGLVASIAPPRLRLIGLFAIALGAGLGWLAGCLAISLRMPSRRVAIAGSLLTGVVGCVVVTLLNWQAYSRELQAAEKPNAGQALVANMLKAAKESGASTPESEAAMAEFHASATRALAESRQRRSFRGFLTHRTAALHLSEMLAISLWAVEILFAGAIAAIVAVRSSRQPFCGQCEHFLTVSRTHRFDPPVPAQLKSLSPEQPVPSTSVITVTLLRCQCSEQSPQVRLEIVEPGSGRRAVVSPECGPSEVRDIARLLDKVEGLSVPT